MIRDRKEVPFTESRDHSSEIKDSHDSLPKEAWTQKRKEDQMENYDSFTKYIQHILI